MRDDELIAKAREHLKAILRKHPLPGLTEKMFTKAAVSVVPLVAFTAENREDIIEISLDEKSGFVRDITHVPHKPRRRS